MNALNNLLPKTSEIGNKLAKLPFLQDFTFVGGSALAIYLGHRLSEDLDFFTWHKQLNPLEIQTILLNYFTEVRTVNLSPLQADFVVEGVKITFFANAWDELKNRHVLLDNLYIAELPVLATMKVNTLFMRAKYRDYYDLYVLSLKHFSLQELFENTSRQMKNLNKALFQRALIFVEDIEDETIRHLSPQYDLSLAQIAHHFEKQIRLWNKSTK